VAGVGVTIVVVVVVVVPVVVVPVVVVPVVVVAVVPVSCTTAGASVFVSLVVVVVSFLQPEARATPMTATQARDRNFFINLISFFLARSVRSA